MTETRSRKTAPPTTPPAIAPTFLCPPESAAFTAAAPVGVPEPVDEVVDAAVPEAVVDVVLVLPVAFAGTSTRKKSRKNSFGLVPFRFVISSSWSPTKRSWISKNETFCSVGVFAAGTSDGVKLLTFFPSTAYIVVGVPAMFTGGS